MAKCIIQILMSNLYSFYIFIYRFILEYISNKYNIIMGYSLQKNKNIGEMVGCSNAHHHLHVSVVA